jgi:cell division protein FtsQ
MWDNPPLLKNIANALFVMSALAVLYGAFHYIAHLPELLPIRTVRLSVEPERVAPSGVLAMVKQNVHGNFLTVDIEGLRQSLQTLPWVRNVSIRREFPDSLVVEIEENKAIARWNDAELVNSQGEVFDAETAEALPSFIGVDGSAAEMTEAYAKFNAQLAVLNVKVDQLALSARHAWQVHLSNGVLVKLGRDALQERMQRYVAYQMIKNAEQEAKKAPGKSVIDMRYQNGFAVRQVNGGAQG